VISGTGVPAKARVCSNQKLTGETPVPLAFFGALLFAKAGLCFGQVQENFMNTMIAGIFGGWEIILILAVVLILFGAKKLPELAKGLGQGIKEFKKATREVTDEIQKEPVDTVSQTAKLPAASPSQPVATVSQNPNPPKA
jgi:sec-independent protein translocase protein TatA